jgi:hypothetical protein
MPFVLDIEINSRYISQSTQSFYLKNVVSRVQLDESNILNNGLLAKVAWAYNYIINGLLWLAGFAALVLFFYGVNINISFIKFLLITNMNQFVKYIGLSYSPYLEDNFYSHITDSTRFW